MRGVRSDTLRVKSKCYKVSPRNKFKCFSSFSKPIPSFLNLNFGWKKRKIDLSRLKIGDLAVGQIWHLSRRMFCGTGKKG